MVISLYNKENHIQRAIRSVLAQTYTDFELIVVDDGSTDSSLVNASNIPDERLRIISQYNMGVSAARNRGVAESKHEWIAFLDADDEWKPDFLAMTMDLQRDFPACKLLASAYIFCREWGQDNSLQRQLNYPPEWRGILNNYYQDLQNSPFCSSSIVLEKELLVRIGGFATNLHKGEDTNTWIRMYQETEFAFTNRVGAIYHLEAENRAIPQPTLLGDDPRKPYSHALLLQQLLREKKIPTSKIQAAIEYMALNDLPVSRQLLEQGYSREARQRLWSYRRTKIYRKKWIRLFVSSCLPYWLIIFYRKFTSKANALEP